MQKDEVVSLADFRKRLDKGREAAIAYTMETYRFSREKAEEWYVVHRGQVIESAIVCGDVDPNLP